MKAKLSEQEYITMRYAAGQREEFTAAQLRVLVCAQEQKKWSENAVKIFLDQLVKKKMIKRRYKREKGLKFTPLYQACYDEEFFLSHTVQRETEDGIDPAEKEKLLEGLESDES